jgi:hypothetical protein
MYKKLQIQSGESEEAVRLRSVLILVSYGTKHEFKSKWSGVAQI